MSATIPPPTVRDGDDAPKPSIPPPSMQGGSAEDRPRLPLLQADKLSKLFPVERGIFAKPRFVHAVDDVTLYIRRGETVGLVGESGSGKSTLGRLMIRLIEPTLGRVVFDGRDLSRATPSELSGVRRRMQIVFQDPYSSLNPRMTVGTIVGEGIEVHRLAGSKQERESLVLATLAKVGLRADMAARYPHELSGGQRQRVGIARALAVKPELLVCDEPVSALDVSVQAQVVNLLEEIQDETSMGILFISHDLRVVTHTSHRIAVMYAGRLVETGPARAVSERPLHPYTRALFDAAPSIEDDGKRRLVLAGEPPSAFDPPAGCAFHPRCPKSKPGMCDRDRPLLKEVETDSHHRVACYFPEESSVTSL